MLKYELSKLDEEELREYYDSIKNYKSLSYTELNNLLHNPTEENQQKFIKGFLMTSLKYSVKLYQELKQYFILPYSIMDFIQLGNETLVKLVYEKRYDNYFKFMWFFNVMLRRNVIKNLLPISWHIIDKYKVFLENGDEFLKKYQHEASDEELMNEYGYKKIGINNLRNYFYQNQASCEQLRDELVTNGWDYIPELVEYLIVKEIIGEVIETIDLSDRYRELLVKYFGFTTKDYDGDNIASDILELVKEYNISRQRIHQIIYNALQKIKADEEAMKKLTLCKEIIF